MRVVLILLLIVIVIVVLIKSTKPVREVGGNAKIAAIYCYFEKNQQYKENFLYFLANGMHDTSVDYHLVLNGACTVDLSGKTHNKNVFIYRRPNKGYDFGAFSHVVKKLSTPYDYFFFINTSVRGPYGKNKEEWVKPFLEMFQADPSTKLVGTTINIYQDGFFAQYPDLSKIYNRGKPYPHVQTMFFGMDREFLEYLHSVDFWNEGKYEGMDFMTLIVTAEIGLSQLCLKKGWNINCIASKYRDIDYRRVVNDHNWSSRDGDPNYPGAYFGGTLRPEDVIFFKLSRF